MELPGRFGCPTSIWFVTKTTGISFAFVAAARGYRMRVVYSDAFSKEKDHMMRYLSTDVYRDGAQGTSRQPPFLSRHTSRQISILLGG